MICKRMSIKVNYALLCAAAADYDSGLSPVKGKIPAAAIAVGIFKKEV